MMELWSLLALKPSFPLFWSNVSWENRLTHVSLTPGASTMKTQAQQVWNITYKTLILTIISLKIIMLVFIT